MKNIISLFSGIIFSLGLGIGGMTDPQKIFGFLDIFGNWDASLVFVMGAAVGVYFLAFTFLKSRKTSFLGDELQIPKNKKIDKKLLIGGFLFGLGWGLGGYCPGPAVVSLVAGSTKVIGFVITMLIGMNLVDFIQKRK